METKVAYLSDLKFNLETWLSELRFHRDEMEKFEDKLEEIAARGETENRALKPLETFQNRIMIEQDVISKLIHRCKAKAKKVSSVDYTENIDGKLQNMQHTLRDDMKTYIKLHYELKEGMMDYFLKCL